MRVCDCVCVSRWVSTQLVANVSLSLVRTVQRTHSCAWPTLSPSIHTTASLSWIPATIDSNSLTPLPANWSPTSPAVATLTDVCCGQKVWRSTLPTELLSPTVEMIASLSSPVTEGSFRTWCRLLWNRSTWTAGVAACWVSPILRWMVRHK